jgi:hypothetical protein
MSFGSFFAGWATGFLTCVYGMCLERQRPPLTFLSLLGRMFAVAIVTFTVALYAASAS